MKPTIRHAQVRDVNSLLDIDLKGYDYPWTISKWREISNDAEFTLLIATLKVQPVSMCVWRWKVGSERAEIVKLATKPYYQGQGFATLLLNKVESDMRSAAVREAVITVPEIKCFPGHPDDVSAWLLARKYKPIKPVLKDEYCMYGSMCDGFQFAHVLGGSGSEK
jgi:N-acetylglutamate synthase-like GNAT family acetyltransferase